ncbi:GAP family protein [Microbacterium lacticum]
MIDITAFGTLAVLALIDSMSFGTLLIPVWLLMAPGRLRAGRIIVYLATVTGAYFAIGLLLIAGASAFLATYGELLQSAPFLIGVLALGIVLMIVSWAMDTKKARARAAERAASGGGRLLGWRTRIMGDDAPGRGSTVGLIALALTAVAIELPSMVPYLAAIGIITSQEVGWSLSALILLGYCVIMIAPALVLTVGRLVARDALERPLSRLDQWLTKHAQATTAWVIGIVGFLLAVNAIASLGWVDTGG